MFKKYYFILLSIIFVVTLVIGSFYDFQINQAIFSNRNAFGIFMAALGEWPFYSLTVFLGAYLITCAFKYFKKDTKRLLYHNVACGILGIALGGYYQGNAITNANGYNVSGPAKFWLFVVGFILMIPGVLLGIYAARKNNEKKYWRLAFYLLFAIAMSILVVTVIKEIMHRPRFRFLVTEDIVPYLNWWEPCLNYKSYLGLAVAEDFKSFPSGHAVSGTCLIALPYVPRLYGMKNPRKTQISLGIFAILYSFLLSFTRMLVGAHFLSDISIGTLLTLIIFAIFVYIIDRFKLLD